MSHVEPTSVHPLIRCLAWVLCCATFPLIFVGGLVTTTDAGMAVPDWPNTYGYNLLLYPLDSWWAGPWNIFIEHGHRLLGVFVGMISVALFVCLTLLCMDRGRTRLRWLSLAMLLAIIAQGVLGGARVLGDARMLALLHGCTGPLVFLLSLILVECCSPRWRTTSVIADQRTISLRILTTFFAASAFVQLLLGAHLRHATEWLSYSAIWLIAIFHVFLAIFIMVETVWIYFRVRQSFAHRQLIVLSRVLVLLLGTQIVLGLTTWLLNYGWPWGTEQFLSMLPQSWAQAAVNEEGTLIIARGFPQTIITTAHVAVGTLILSFGGLMSFRSWSLFVAPRTASRTANHAGSQSSDMRMTSRMVGVNK